MATTRAELEQRYAEAKIRYSEAYEATHDPRYKYISANIQLKDSHLNTFYVYSHEGIKNDTLIKMRDNQVYTQFGITDHIRAKIHGIPRGHEYQVSWLHCYETEVPTTFLEFGPPTEDPLDQTLTFVPGKTNGVQCRWASYTGYRPKDGPASSDNEIEDILEHVIGGDKNYYQNLVAIDSVVFKTLDPGSVSKPVAGSIFGAKEGLLPLHCIDAVLRNNKRKLLNLPVGVHKSVAELEPLVRRGKDVQLVIHNRLTHMLGMEPLYTIGLNGKKKIEVVCQFSHFTQCLLKNKDIEQVKYVRGIDPDALGDAFNIVTMDNGFEPEVIGYTTLVDNKITIVKTYRPADESPTYYTCYNEASYQFKRFVVGNNFKRCVNYVDEVSASIMYPPILKRAKFGKHMIELDRNKAYPSSIVGNVFPTQSLVMGELDPSLSTLAFVFVDKVLYLDQHAAFYLSGVDMGVIPAPMYRYLAEIGCKFEAKYALYSVMKPIVLDCPTFPKTLRNTVIGKLIQSHKSKDVVLPRVGREEFDSLAYTAVKAGLLHSPLTWESVLCQGSTVDMTIKCPPKPAYQHIYSFIMAYHNIAMIKKIREFEFDSVKAVYVDALFIDAARCEVKSSTVEGEFKLDKIKQYHYDLPVKEIEPVKISKEVKPISVLPIALNSQVTWVTGPAGCGKSYPWLRLLENNFSREVGQERSGKAEQKAKPRGGDYCLLTPTCELRDAFKAKKGSHGGLERLLEKAEQKELIGDTPSVHTAAKMFQFSMSDSAYASRARMYYRPIYVVDEFTMFTREQFETMLRRQPNSFFVMLGDPCQICNCVNGRSILGCVDNVIEWKGVEGKRRQSGEFVEFLDSMRGLGVCEQREKAIKYFDYGRKEDCSVVIGGTWSQLGNVNAWFLDRNEEIPVRVIKGSSTVRKIIKKASVEKDQVFHIRRTFAEAKQPIEVAFASTVDSYQGSTLEGKVGILVADLSRPGALYTALTRVKDRCQIVLLG